MNDECTKGKDKRDDNYSRGVHGALRVLVTPTPCFALTRSDQIGRLQYIHNNKRQPKLWRLKSYVAGVRSNERDADSKIFILQI